MTQEPLGLYVQIYPSTLEGASRMFRIGRSVHERVGFERTELVGVLVPGLPERAPLADGVELVRISGTSRTGNLGRVLRVLRWQPRVYQHYRRRRVDAVACHNVWILPMCWLLARRSGAALVYNPHELETETATMRGPKKWAARTIERLLVRRCDLVSTVNEPIAHWYADHYSIAEPVAVGNVPDQRSGHVDLRTAIGVGDDTLLYVHTGNLAGGRNIPRILAAFGRSRHHVLFLGDGPFRSEVQAAAAAHVNIHWWAPVPPDQIVAHVRGADVGLCLIETDYDLSKKLSSPNKLTEALAAGTPVLCTDLAEARRLLGPLSRTWVLDDIDDLDEALEAISDSDVAAFRDQWSGIREWDDEVADLVAAYEVALTRRRRP